MPYHHGDLRRALLDTALAAIAEHGPAAVSLRDVARRAGRHSEGEATDSRVTALAAWSLVHGLSALLLEGTVSPEPGSDVATLARSVTGRLRP